MLRNILEKRESHLHCGGSLKSRAITIIIIIIIIIKRIRLNKRDMRSACSKWQTHAEHCVKKPEGKIPLGKFTLRRQDIKLVFSRMR
jgi:hypothetical protein